MWTIVWTMRIGVKALPALNVDNVDNYIQLILRIKIYIYRVAIVALEKYLSKWPMLSTFAHALLLPAFSPFPFVDNVDY